MKCNWSLRLGLAQGLGSGRIPWAPGTFGSLVGLGWTALLLAPKSFSLLAAGTLAGFGLSVWLCGAGEKLLNQKDPGSIVLDEITALPLCFFAWIGLWCAQGGNFPDFGLFLTKAHGPWLLVIFGGFRLFDILKPWPVRQSQNLPGGWGVTVDDFLAAAYVNLLVWVLSRVWPL